MLIGILELRHSFQEHVHLYLFSVFVLLTWAIWIAQGRPLAARTGRGPSRTRRRPRVVIPVVDEPLDLFRDVLSDGSSRSVRRRSSSSSTARATPPSKTVCDEFAPAVEWTWTPIAGKRNAVQVGVEQRDRARSCCSSTATRSGRTDTLAELIKPFIDPTVGGVTTRQRILDPRRNFLTRWADWLENSRALYSMPAQSVLGTVGCLPGRTIAFRRSVLEDVMHDFMTQKFLGVFLEVSDDRTLTNLTLKRGYRTVYQSTSLVYTDAPTAV